MGAKGQGGQFWVKLNHLKSFKYEKYRKETTLSEHIWGLKDKGVNFELSWRIIDRASPFSPVTGICAICTLEKYYIIFKPELGTINKRDEINTGCRHKSAMLLDKTWENTLGIWHNRFHICGFLFV